MASSLVGIALCSGFAAGQVNELRPVPLTYDVKVSPWPTMPKARTNDGSFMVPGAAFAAPAPPVRETPASRPNTPPQPNVLMVTPSPKTLYYRKESHAPVQPSWAAELNRPIGRTDVNKLSSEADPPAARPGDGASGREKKLFPDPTTLFALDGENEFIQRENQRRASEDATVPVEKRRKPIEFPALAVLPGADSSYAGRFFPQQTSLIEPNYVCYRRLFFEDRNAERYGWSLGPLQPIASAWKFVGDWITAPYRFGSQPLSRYECSAGLCLPGDHVPYMIYPPGLSAAGAAVQTGITLMLIFTIP
jgi:hypothetical protein